MLHINYIRRVRVRRTAFAFPSHRRCVSVHCMCIIIITLSMKERAACLQISQHFNYTHPIVFVWRYHQRRCGGGNGAHSLGSLVSVALRSVHGAILARARNFIEFVIGVCCLCNKTFELLPVFKRVCSRCRAPSSLHVHTHTHTHGYDLI